MEKKNKIIFLTIAVIAIVAIAVFLASGNKDGNRQADLSPVNNEGEVENTIADEGLESSEVPVASEIDIAEDFDWKQAVNESDFEIEFMTDAEKSAMGIPAERRVQVLGRHETGVILAYKVIESDEDIVTSVQD
jgi:hypothetical protein